MNSPLQGAQDEDGAMPSEEEMRDALARVVSSDSFTSAPRLQQFLSYVVEETIAGRDAAIKGKGIAMDVYDRDIGGVNSGQNLVRVEARRLRRRLNEYYAGPGASDPWRILIDVGGYSPRFEPGTPVESAIRTGSSPAARIRWQFALAASVLVLVFAGVVTVVSRTGPAETNVSADGAERNAMRMRSMQALQAVNFAEQARGMLFPVFDSKRQELALGMFRHAIELDPGLPHGYAGAAQVLASLALTAPDADSGFREEATFMAEKALALAPSDPWAQAANGWVLAVSGDLANGLSSARLAVELAPDDGHVLDLAGMVAIVVNAPRFAADVSNPERPRTGVGRFGANNIWGVSQYMLGNYPATIEAFTGAPESGAPVSAPSLIFLAVAYDHLGEVQEAERLVEELEETWADFPTRAILSRIFQNEPAYERDILEHLSRHGYQTD